MQLGNQNVEERRSESHSLIQDLVRMRTEMLSLYSQLAAGRPFTDDDGVVDLLEEFCEVLVDYTASAHFRLYRFLEEDRERRRAVLELAERVYPRIAEITQAIVDFNDRYEDAGKDGCLPGLEKDLSRLGEKLAERIELEDQLIDVMCMPRQRARRGLDS
ncbi:MAG: sigma D regulator [Gammaproteobacteria bacterium]|nr:sigma D regulator [Gammaproteobacteria bacterium]NIR28565.1 sigma D regulator [Gammaproteobacteria bacterium]NIR97035.1 sigma D regulator [Gammaproteobacteria bacterium]NIT62733.1 sigma D regulator [Gammaproteobacteria bacterium]NIV19691.1 Rsd/AlgQ family anti-sigma factor [Gammaproteobacteria bacterium]